MTDIAKKFGRTLVIAPHPDDEVLGAGGTMARLAEAGEDVFVAVVTAGRPPMFSAESVAKVRSEAIGAHAALGVKNTFWLDQPAAQLPEVPNAILNSAIFDIVKRVAPATLLIPFVGDIHVDHQLVFRSAMVAARPHQADFPRNILAYETMSETNWNAAYLTPSFTPNVFVEIDRYLERKLDAMKLFSTQLRDPPHERSIDSLRALAQLRGACVHRAAAEAFVQIRNLI